MDYGSRRECAAGRSKFERKRASTISAKLRGSPSVSWFTVGVIFTWRMLHAHSGFSTFPWER